VKEEGEEGGPKIDRDRGQRAAISKSNILSTGKGMKYEALTLRGEPDMGQGNWHGKRELRVAKNQAPRGQEGGAKKANGPKAGKTHHELRSYGGRTPPV